MMPTNSSALIDPGTSRVNRNPGLVALTLLTIVLLLPGAALPQGGSMTLVDTSNQAGPGPGDVVINRTPFGTFVYNASFVTGQPGEIVTHRLGPDGRLTFIARTAAGREPRALALVRNGEFLVVANSIDDEIRALQIKDGIPQPLPDLAARGSVLVDRSLPSGPIFGQGGGQNPAPSGGEDPFDVAAFAGSGFVFVVNRGSNNACAFRVSDEGRLEPFDCVLTAPDPHLVTIDAQGNFVGVGTEGDFTLALFKTADGRLQFSGQIQLLTRPRDVAIYIAELLRACAAVDMPGANEDLIRCHDVDSNGQVTGVTDTPAGHFLTDIDVLPNMLFAPPDFDPGLNMIFAATVNINGPGFADDRDEIRSYRIDPQSGTLSPVGAVQTPTVPPNFKQIAIDPQSGTLSPVGAVPVVSTEFQSNGILRSFSVKR